MTPTLLYCAEKHFNVPTQLVIYPGEHHVLLVPSYLRDRLERLIGWYGRWLGA